MTTWTFEPGHTAAEFCVRHMMVSLTFHRKVLRIPRYKTLSVSCHTDLQKRAVIGVRKGRRQGR